MKRRYKKKKDYLIKIIIVISLFLLVYFFASKEKVLKIESFFNNIGANIENFFIPNTKVNLDNVINGINRELEEENNKLKSLLELKQDNYTFINADVINRNIDWYCELTINKGKINGIEKDMAVVVEDGLIGRIKTTTKDSSTVTLISCNSSNIKVAVDVKSNENTYHGIMDSYLDDGLIQVSNINKTSDIKLNDKVYTNGLGGIFPSGIYIGEIVDISTDSMGLSKVIKVKTQTNYDKIRYVSVITRGD